MLNYLFLYLRPFVGRVRGDERGVTATEYGLILALVAIAIIAGATILGDNLDVIFRESGNAVKANK